MIDRRVRKTQNLLRTALHSLIAEKPYDEISIKEILDRANVGRSTFYTHFRDKDELLRSSIHDMVQPVRSKPMPRSGKWHERIVWFSLPMFEYHHRHRHADGSNVSAGSSAILHQHLKSAIAGMITDAVKDELPIARRGTRRIAPDLLVDFVASTFILVFSWWLESRSALSPEQVNDVFRLLVLPSLAGM